MSHEDICVARKKKNIQRMRAIKTAHGSLKLYRDWDHEGAVCMENPQTIKRYRELSNQHPDSDEYGIFWAFSNKQFDEGKQKMKERGLYKDGQKIWSIGAGGYGVSEELIDKFMSFYTDRRKQIAKECDPQEVYIHEWNEHECMFDFDDSNAYDIVVGIFGEEVCKGIKRLNEPW